MTTKKHAERILNLKQGQYRSFECAITESKVLAQRVLIFADVLEKIDRKLCKTLDLGVWSVPSVEVRESLELIRQALKQAGEA
ncbi:hypothetical protein [Maridesulfovibrio ferrireducens]|uniref:hypothetical protein n=1 Tax=Maridesulfovibrio ferrireducens TaxID=246191 RepID=UPI001A217A5A|nr:hypothetical protein [Maridesulfovibrio ferrireducens]MBI9113283.1 hypothetical protein [Maridesulfovibrio ferrireducens]